MIPKEVQVGDLLFWADLKSSPKEWAKKMEEIKGKCQRMPYKDAKAALAKGGYEIRQEVKKLEVALLGEAEANS